MQKQTLRLRKRSASRFLFPLASTGLVLLFLFVIFPLVPEIKLASATIDNTVYGLELATNPSINISIQPTAAGAISVAKDTVTANTNSPSGYKLYLSVNKDLDGNIYLNGDANNDSASTKFIPTTGTFESPSALSQNSWGYAVAGLNNFDTTYNITTPSISSKFANLPTANNEQLIHDHSGVATDDITDIYYGVKADINIASGSYSTELLYTTLSDASSEVQGEAEVSPSQVNNGYTATELTITTSLVTNKNLGTISAMIGSAACEDIELVTNNPVTVACTLPAGLVGGKYNVVLNIPNLGKSYTIENGFEVSPQVTANVAEGSAGYGTISNNGFIAPYGTPITTNGNTITIGTQTITATPAAQTAQYTHAFANWTNNCGTTVTANCTISANFTRTTRSYTITWNANGGSVSPTTTTKQYGTAIGTLPTPTYTGYNFGGWFTAASGGTQILATTTVTSDVTYYAHWTAANLTGLTYMQDMSPAACANTVLETQVQLIDSRDNKLYWVAKLADGNCWMTQNLDYDITTVNVISNNDGTTSEWRTNKVTSTSGFNSAESGAYSYSYDPGSNYLRNGTGTATAITCTSVSNGGENCHYHQGNYYQWDAAVAETGDRTPDASSSICPKGWRLPTATSSDDLVSNYNFGKLLKAYKITMTEYGTGSSDGKLIRTPLYFVRGGTISSSSLSGQGSGGYYWSSRKKGSAIGTMTFNSSFVQPKNGSSRSSGYSIRCVAISNNVMLNDISTMQEMTPEIVAATPENTSKQLIDTRDNKLYWVTKLADGNIWMTQNLDYDIKATSNRISNNDGTTDIWSPNTATTTTIYNNTSYTGTYSYDPGNYYMPNGTGSNTSIASLTDTSIIGNTNAHYHQGNYYQYNAATAGTGGTTASTDATSSICPKGWRLPTGNSDSANYSFGNLVKQYGYSGSNQSASDATLLASPLFFARGGNVRSGSLNYQGSYGRYWSSRADSDTEYAYNLYFFSSFVYPSDNGGNRRYGFSVRCVAL